MVLLIYCGGDKKIHSLAQKHGFMTGATQHHIGKLAPFIQFLDNDFKKPDLKNFIECLEKYSPQFAVLPDVIKIDQLFQLREIEHSFPKIKCIYVPKCNCFDQLTVDDYIGYAFPNKFSDYGSFPLTYYQKFTHIHILGGSPPKQKILSKYLRITSVDCNNFLKPVMIAHKAFFANKPNYRQITYLSMYELIDISFAEIKKYWSNYKYESSM